MLPSIALGAALALFAATVGTIAACPSSCDCQVTINGIAANCRNQGLRFIPGLSTDTYSLDISHNPLSSLTISSFPSLPNLSILILDECSLNEISAKAFANLPALQNVTITNNVLTTFHADAFDNVPKLEYLYLNDNQLEVLPDRGLSGLQLKELFLENNKLADLSPLVFEDASIEQLNLNGNSFYEIREDTMSHLRTSLRTIEVSNNLVPLTIKPTAFRDFTLDSLLISNSQMEQHTFLEYTSTQVLDISDNLFLSWDFTPYSSLNSITALYARGLDMMFLEDEFLTNFNELRLLNLARNGIILFEGRTFLQTPKLEELDLADNAFMSLPDDLGRYLPKLKRLKLSRCSLTSLNPLTFQQMGDLESLDLRNNKLQVIPPSMQPIFEQVGPLLQLAGNPLHCNCEMRWFREWVEAQDFFTGAEMCLTPRVMRLLSVAPEQFTCTPPTIVSLTPAIVAVEGDNVTLRCSAEGDPAPDIQISSPFGEDMKITPSDNRTITRIPAIWMLRNIGFDKTGEYRCHATNVAGEKVAITTVTVVAFVPTTTTTSTTTTTTVTTTVEATTAEETTAAATTSEKATTAAAKQETTSTIAMVTSHSTKNATTAEVVGTSPSTIHTLSNTPSVLVTDNDAKISQIYIVLIGVVLSVLVATVIVIVLVIYLARKKNKRKYDVKEHETETLRELNATKLSTAHDVIRVTDERTNLTAI